MTPTPSCAPSADRSPREHIARRYPDRREASARAFQTGVYSMQEIADYFGVHHSTVSRAVRRLETGIGSMADLLTEPQNA